MGPLRCGETVKVLLLNRCLLLEPVSEGCARLTVRLYVKEIKPVIVSWIRASRSHWTCEAEPATLRLRVDVRHDTGPHSSRLVTAITFHTRMIRLKGGDIVKMRSQGSWFKPQIRRLGFIRHFQSSSQAPTGVSQYPFSPPFREMKSIFLTSHHVPR